MDMNPVFNRLSAIPAEIAQVQYDLERLYRRRHYFYTRRRIDVGSCQEAKAHFRYLRAYRLSGGEGESSGGRATGSHSPGH